MAKRQESFRGVIEIRLTSGGYRGDTIIDSYFNYPLDMAINTPTNFFENNILS